MYWLLPPEVQEKVRDEISALVDELVSITNRIQIDQKFPYTGRKDRRIARSIIRHLTTTDATICDPFSGSGIFGYAGLDEGRRVLMNEWEPYAFRMSGAPFRILPTKENVDANLSLIDSDIGDYLRWLYQIICANCGRMHVLDGLFYDREPPEYFHPTQHNRMGPAGENMIFRKRYKCECGSENKFFDASDMEHLVAASEIVVEFPNDELIENSRINLTSPDFVHYGDLFPHRSKVALMTLLNRIDEIDDLLAREFFFDVFLSILLLAKYTDYRSKSQDPHCPPNRLKETNLYHRFIEKAAERWNYLNDQHFSGLLVREVACEDFRAFLDSIDTENVSLLFTDPPYGDSAPYFELAQRFHPFMHYSLRNDSERLRLEVVVSNAPSREDKHNRNQFLDDIETLFLKSSRIVEDHGYLVLYFRPEQGHWVADLNKLKVFGRKHGFEPLIAVDVGVTDPSMRVLASTAWTFARDACFVFLKLREEECRWYEGDIDIDEIIYLAARESAGRRGDPFTNNVFHENLNNEFRSRGLLRLSSPDYSDRIHSTLLRFCTRQGGQYALTGESPYEYMYYGVDAELRVREFTPVVVEELSPNGEIFTFEQFILRLSTYLDNGNRKIIQRLEEANRLIPDLLLRYADRTADGEGFVARPLSTYTAPAGRVNLLTIDPTEFEHLIAEFFNRRDFRDIQVIGRSRDRGVDILATAPDGSLHLIQCKRWRPGSNVGSGPIQRVDSYKRTRNANQAWVITTSDFTAEGRSEARLTGVQTINGLELQDALDLFFPGEYFIPTR